MPIRVVAAESARVAVLQVGSFPTDGEDVAPLAEVALTARSSTSKADVHTWHRRLGHLHIDAVLQAPARPASKANKRTPKYKRLQSHMPPTFSAESSQTSAGSFLHTHTTVSNTS